jgi:HEAT repeat protein
MERCPATLRSTFSTAQESAILAMGMFGHPRALDLLSDICQDRATARQLLQKDSAVPERARALAALSLGLLGDRRGIDPLVMTLEAEPGSRTDLKSCATVALGLFAVEQEAIVRQLVRILDEQRLDRRVRCQAPTAIAQLVPAGQTALGTWVCCATAPPSSR